MSDEVKYAGINRFARVMQQRMERVAATPPCLDFGQIQEDYSLKTYSFPLPIPLSDYQVCRGVTVGPVATVLTQTQAGQGAHPHGPSGAHSQQSGSGEHSHPASEGVHVHDVLVPEKLRRLLPGDFVLVAWVGSDAVVIDLILPAKEVIAE